MSWRNPRLGLSLSGSDYFDRTGVFQLPLIDCTGVYECALGFNLAASERAFVERLRAELAWPAPLEHQLEPHVTVLFVGGVQGKAVLNVHAALSELEWTAITAQVSGLDVFRSDDSILNLHLRIESDELRALHNRAYLGCIAKGMKPQTPYVLERYVAHVSIYDRLNMHNMQEAPRVALPAMLHLERLHVMAKRLQS